MDDRQGPSPRQALLNGGAALAVICVLVVTGMVMLVKVLASDSTGGHRSVAVPQPQPVSSPLPSTALPAPGQPQQAASGPGPLPGQQQYGPGHKLSRGFHLRARPASVSPMEHIDLIGTYPHHAGLTINVQRREGGHWTSFAGLDTSVSKGAFRTWVMTGRPGPNRFRMVDPSSGRASNAVTVTVG